MIENIKAIAGTKEDSGAITPILPKAKQPKRDATIRDLYAAARDLGEWGDARADSIAETCRAAAVLLESEV